MASTELAAKIEYEKLLSSNDIFDIDKMLLVIEQFLAKYPNYSRALRLRGILIDSTISIDEKNGIQVLDDKRNILILNDFTAAFAADNEFTLVLIDIGDYWFERNCFAKAIEFYDKAIHLLDQGHFSDSYDEELELAYKGKIMSLVELGDLNTAEMCRNEAKQRKALGEGDIHDE